MTEPEHDANPRFLPRKCGGWLAVSHRWCDIKIGVTAETKDEALVKYFATMAAWRALLAPPHTPPHGKDER